jgi:hypothetical protein
MIFAKTKPGREQTATLRLWPRAPTAFMELKLNDGGMQPELTGRPGYHASTPLKIYIYGYLNRIQSSRRLEREAQRNPRLRARGHQDSGTQAPNLQQQGKGAVRQSRFSLHRGQG